MLGLLIRRWYPNSLSTHSRAMALLNGLHFCNDGCQAALLMLLPIIAASSALSSWSVGMLATVHLSLGVVLAIPASWLAARSSSLKVLLAAMFLYGVSLVALPLMQSFTLIVIVYLVAGTAFGVFHPLAFALVAEKSSERSLGQSMGWFTAIGDIGRATITAAIAAIIAVAAWPPVYAALGASVLVIGGGLLLTARQSPHNAPPRLVSDATADQRAQSGSRNRRFVITCAIGFMDALVGSGLVVFLPLLCSTKGMSSASSGMALACFFAASLLGKVAMGRLSDIVGKRRSIMACQIALALTVIAFAIVSHHGMLLVLAFAAGVASKGSLPALMALSAEQLSRDALRKGFGANQMVLGLATTISPLLYGSLAAVFGIEFAFVGVGMVAVASAVVARVGCGG